ncbi:MAG: LPS export ABC transporter periplasmic protein LptC [Spirochaetia bacterium]|jgi:LPS export ABC transporter protein LptC|nr:LPS export ABC transporter periplasmic protein LptC [Spirochaetia bacterium]
MQEIKLFFPLLFISFILSCSMDYENMEIVEELGNNIPDNVIENFSYTNVDNGNISFRLYSKKAENYSQKNETLLTKVVFREYNSKNEIITEGTAAKGLIHTDSDDAELTGSLIIYSAENEAEITADYLYWNDSEKTLTGSDEGHVKLNKDSGTQISGSGFTGDIKLKKFTFDNTVQGKYHYEED